jgi:hypothetical protein
MGIAPRLARPRGFTTHRDRGKGQAGAPPWSSGRAVLTLQSQFPPAETVDMHVEDGLPGMVMGIAQTTARPMAQGSVRDQGE